jgi:hypothetical protein
MLRSPSNELIGSVAKKNFHLTNLTLNFGQQLTPSPRIAYFCGTFALSTAECTDQRFIRQKSTIRRQIPGTLLDMPKK